MRIHLGRERRRPPPRGRDGPRRDRGGDHLRAEARSIRPRHLRDERDARLEPLVLAARDGRPGDLRRRRRRGPQGRSPEHQRGLRRRQAVRDGRGPPPRPPGDPPRGDDVLARGDPGSGAGGAHAQPPDRRACARRRRREAVRRGGHRRDRARHLRRRRGDRDDRRAPRRHLRRPRARLPLGHPPEGPRLRDLAGDDRRLRLPGRVGARLPGDAEDARGRRPDHPRRRLRLHLVPARRVREGHRGLRHRHGLLADGGDRRRRRSMARS